MSDLLEQLVRRIAVLERRIEELEGQHYSPVYYDPVNERYGIGTTTPADHLGDASPLVVEIAATGGFLVRGAEGLHKSVRQTDTTSGELWQWSHRTHANGNRFEAWYYDGAAFVAPVISMDAKRDVGFGGVGAGIAAQVHIDQSSASGAQPVLFLDQADVSEEMIEFVSTIGVGNAIEAVGGKTLTVTHFVKVTLPGPLTRYIQVGTIA